VCRWGGYSIISKSGCVHTVCKMGLILCSIERMLKMQFSMASKFTLQPLCRYDIIFCINESKDKTF
jgi:hypothetical protein